jgi:hypothetical protein
MGRRRVRKIALPEHVHWVKAGGRSYFYYQEGRGRKNREERGARLKIAGNPFAPAGTPDNARFWAELNQIVATRIDYPAKSIGALVNRYRSDDAYLRLEQATRECYDVHLNRFQKPEAWGLLETTRLTPFAVKTARDAIKATPVMANQMLSVGNILYDWGMLFGIATANPFEKVPPLEVVDRGHIPWPPWALGYVRSTLLRIYGAWCGSAWQPASGRAISCAWDPSTAQLFVAGREFGAAQRKLGGASGAYSLLWQWRMRSSSIAGQVSPLSSPRCVGRSRSGDTGRTCICIRPRGSPIRQIA